MPILIEHVAWNKSSLLPKHILQNPQTLQLFEKIIKKKECTNVTKIPSWKAWLMRPSGLLNKRRKRKRF
jgi:hypothetical protein